MYGDHQAYCAQGKRAKRVLDAKRNKRKNATGGQHAPCATIQKRSRTPRTSQTLRLSYRIATKPQGTFTNCGEYNQFTSYCSVLQTVSIHTLLPPSPNFRLQRYKEISFTKNTGNFMLLPTFGHASIRIVSSPRKKCCYCKAATLLHLDR